MNLSHVERYFADFLSAMESGKEIQLHSGETEWDGVPPSIQVPENLFIIGTVNIDETTYMFSPKVLDRANVIEFRIRAEELANFLEDPRDLKLTTLSGKGAQFASDFINIAKGSMKQFKDKEKLNDELMNFFIKLKKTGAEFGYRSAFEINRLASISYTLENDWELSQIIDVAIMQKLLPKLHGSRRKLQDVLESLASLCLEDGEDPSVKLKEFDNVGFDDSDVKYPISFEKIARMYSRVMENGFTSYAEA